LSEREPERRKAPENDAAKGGSWLLSGHANRARMLDMEDRLRPVRLRAFVVLMGALVACAPWVGLWTIAPLVLAAAVFAWAESTAPSSARPERVLFAAWVSAEALIALSIVLTGSHGVYFLPLLAGPIVTLSARFSSRGITAGVCSTLALMTAAALLADAHMVGRFPPLLIAPATLAVVSAILSTALMQSDVDHRGEAAVDSLTGLLNGRALELRAIELERQSAWSLLPVAIIVVDVDRFKLVNDAKGHAVGDAVLRAVAGVFRERLRAYDLAYRLSGDQALRDGEAFRPGGDELLVMLPGATIPAAVELADDIRAGVETELSGDGGQSITVSCGVAGSIRGTPFDYPRTFRRADAALYRAKAEGRNRVCVAEDLDGESPSPALQESDGNPDGGMPATG
jgi:GGDEF domain-containing protein